MAFIFIRNAARVVTFDNALGEIDRCDVLIKDNRIAAIGPALQAPLDARVIDASGMLCLPGLVNCHHHLYQTLTRNVPRVQNSELFDWLIDLYEIWREITPEFVYISALLGLSELLITGCTTSTDHLYLFPRASDPKLIDMEIRAARELGIRFHPTRGCMSRGKSSGGLPPDDVVQTEEEILLDCERLIAQFHDPAPEAMTKIALAPCSPFSVEERTMVELAKLARAHGLRLHTHMAETKDEERYCIENYGMRPIEWADKIDWLGSDVWFAHVVYANSAEIARLAKTQTGVAHCPASNMRLGSGIAPIPEMVRAGVPVGLGVDGSASNDTSDMWGEARNALLLHRVQGGAKAIDARTVLRLASRGGAQVLGFEEAGIIAPGMLADIILIDLNQLGFAGALHDPAAAILFAGYNHTVAYNIVNGEIVVEQGRLTRKKEEQITQSANEAARELVSRATKKTGIRFLEPREA